MRLLVCGSRDWTDRNAIARELIALAPDVVIHGAATGADFIAETEAKAWGRTSGRGISVVGYPAEWARDGKAAGPIRNARMLAEGKPDRGLAFGALRKRDTFSRSLLWRHTGTGDMVAKMLRAGLPVRWVATPGSSAVDLTKVPVPS